MRIRSLILVTLVSASALALTSACGSSNKSNGGGGSGGTGGAAGAGGAGAAGTAGSGGSASGDCNSVATALCNKLNQCSPLGLQLTYGDVTTCVSRAATSCKDGTTAPGASVSPAQFAACAAAFSSLDCSQWVHGVTMPSACIIPGSLADGKPCGSADQCKSGFCSVSTGICGACAEPVGAGQKCTSNAGCTSGLVCNSSGQCAQPVAAGGSCTTLADCDTGLVCASSKCVQPLAAGKACTGGDCDHLAGAFCNPSSKVCETIQAADAGKPCGLVSGAFVLCSAGGHCTIPTGQTQGTCLAHAADGASCDIQNGPNCLQPALCVNKQCTLGDPSSCK